MRARAFVPLIAIIGLAASARDAAGARVPALAVSRRLS
jgi:hypothetical protein